LSGVFVFLGIYYLRKSRLLAYRMFEWSVLVSILLTYVFVFYKEQFAALAGLTFNVLILIGLRIMIRREQADAIAREVSRSFGGFG
jgi:Ca2+/H+ antiporter